MSQVRQVLLRLMQERGAELCNDARRLKALLTDLCPADKGDVAAVVSAVEQGVPRYIRQASLVPWESLAARLVRKLVDEAAMAPEHARTAVETWGMALGRVPLPAPVQTRPKPPPLATPSSARVTVRPEPPRPPARTEAVTPQARTDRRNAPPDRDDDRPPRRRRRGRYDDWEDIDFDAARERVATAGLWLSIVGWGSVVLTILVVIGFALVGVEARNHPVQNGPDPVGMFIISACCGTLGLPYFVLMGFGGQRMRSLSGRGWALTGAILGIASFLLFGLFGAVHMGIGIWALTVLLDSNVKAAFRFREEEHGRHRRYDRDEDAD